MIILCSFVSGINIVGDAESAVVVKEACAQAIGLMDLMQLSIRKTVSLIYAWSYEMIIYKIIFVCLDDL